MEPVTHILTGVVLARAGFNRKARYATAAMAVAAELPDVDTLWGLGGPVVGFEHHRGITHTFVGVPVEAAVIVAACWAWHRSRNKQAEAGSAPVSWGWLYGAGLVALLSHLLLDWTNNYGLRPLFPFDARWFAGSFVFIFEPVMFALLVGALVMPWLFGLVSSEVGERRAKFVGRGWALAALAGVAALYGLRYVEHGNAIRIATVEDEGNSSRVFASPHPGNPFAWAVVSEQPETYRLGAVDTWRGVMDTPTPSDTIYKPETTIGLLAAKRTFLGRVYLDWSSYPVITETPGAGRLTTVSFADARFMYDVSFMHGRTKPPISGEVTLDMAAPEGHRVVETKTGEKAQH